MLRFLVRAALLSAVFVPATACSYFDSCVYEIRAIEAVGQVTEGGTEILYAKINLSEQRDYQPDKSMYWLIRGATLKDHVISAIIIDSRDPTRVFHSVPVVNEPASVISEGAIDETGGANLNGLFEVIADGRARVEVRTDLPGRELLVVTPVVTLRQDWTRPNCS